MNDLGLRELLRAEFGAVNERLARQDARLERIENKIDGHADRITRVEERQIAAHGAAVKWGGGVGAFAGAFVAALAALLGLGHQR